METRVMNVWYADVAGSSASDARGAVLSSELFRPINQSCTHERTDFCNAVMRSDARLARYLAAHGATLSARCAVSVYDGMVALKKSFSALSSYAKARRHDLQHFSASAKWGQERLYNFPTEIKKASTPECRSALNRARPKLQQLGVVK